MRVCLIRGLYYKLILQCRTTKAVFISGHRYQFLQRRARKTRENPTHGAAATHCPAHLVLCRLRRCTAGNALKRRSVNTRREPSPSPARCCGATLNGRILERGRHGVRRPRLAIRGVGPEIRPGERSLCPRARPLTGAPPAIAVTARSSPEPAALSGLPRNPPPGSVPSKRPRPHPAAMPRSPPVRQPSQG